MAGLGVSPTPSGGESIDVQSLPDELADGLVDGPTDRTGVPEGAGCHTAGPASRPPVLVATCVATTKASSRTITTATAPPAIHSAGPLLRTPGRGTGAKACPDDQGCGGAQGAGAGHDGSTGVGTLAGHAGSTGAPPSSLMAPPEPCQPACTV